MTLRAAALRLALAAIAGGVPLHALETASDTTDITTASVELDGEELFRVRGVSSFDAGTRARLIRERLVGIAGDRGISPDAIRLVDEGRATLIAAGNRPIVTVTDADASLEQIGRAELAAAHRGRLQQAVAAYRQARSPSALRRDAVRALIDTLLFAATMLVMRWLWRAADRVLIRRLQARVQSVEVQSHGLMTAQGLLGALRSVIRGLRLASYVAVVLVFAGSALGRFPWTRSASRDVLHVALDPLRVIGMGLLANLPRLAFLAVLVMTLRVALRLIRLFFESVGRGTVTLRDFEPEWAQPTYKITRTALVALGVVVAYPYIPGSESAAFKGVSLFAGVVLSLGSSTAIANVIAGYMMTYRRAFHLGDRVRIGETLGEVIETRLQVTRLRTPKNEEIIVPNSQILTGLVVNYSSLAASRGLILHTEIGVGYETSWTQVEQMLLAAAARTRGISRDPPPFVLEKALGQFAVTYELNVYSRDARAMLETYAALHRNVLDVFNERDVQIMVPAYEGDPAVRKVAPPYKRPA